MRIVKIFIQRYTHIIGYTMTMLKEKSDNGHPVKANCSLMYQIFIGINEGIDIFAVKL